MFPDFKELLASFNAHNVKYLIVGGYAVSFHAQPRATKDLDLWHLEDPRKFIRFGREPIAVEILPSIDGVDFDEAWARRVDAVIDPEHGLRAFFISRTDLALSTSSFREGESDCKGRRWAVTHAIKQVLRLRFAPLRMTDLFGIRACQQSQRISSHRRPGAAACATLPMSRRFAKRNAPQTAVKDPGFKRSQR